MENKKKIYLSWNQYQICIEDLTEEIKYDKQVYDGVFGIPRGGLPVAVSLSHSLGLPLLKKPTLNTIICDDISDNGDTLFRYKDNPIATVYTTPWTKVIPDFFVLNKTIKDSWVIFPWENI